MDLAENKDLSNKTIGFLPKQNKDVTNKIGLLLVELGISSRTMVDHVGCRECILG